MPGSIPASVLDEPSPRAAIASPGAVARRRLLRHPGFLFGAAVVLIIVLAALAAPLITQHDPLAQNLARRLLPPVWEARGSWTHVLGTDHLGRDYLARLLYGARISLMIGFVAAGLGCAIGTALGVAAGFFGGRVDQAVSYILTCQLALPRLMFAMALVFLVGPSVEVVTIVLGLLHWKYFLVVARSATQRLRDQEFIMAARAMGASRAAILWREVLPNLLSGLIVVFSFEVGEAIVAEATLSFLGVGIPSPTPSWGLMIAEGRNSMFFRPWLILLPGFGLFMLVVAMNLLGDGLRDATALEGRS
jgi:peptide/nickel transport system permease protein